MTTSPAELQAIMASAQQGNKTQRLAIEELAEYVGDPDSWSWGTLSGNIDCSNASDPEVIHNYGGGPSVVGKAYLYHMTGDEQYAAAAREHVLDLTDTTYWGGEVYSGANQCILNLSWFMPRYIETAALLSNYPGWTDDDQRQFDEWLSTEVYKKVSWSSMNRQNNWGSAGSYTAALIGDYLRTSHVQTLTDHRGVSMTPAEAYEFHSEIQLTARIAGQDALDSDCEIWGIQPHGGIPDELRRGSTGCNGTAIKDNDSSLVYQFAHIDGLVAHAELMAQNGDTSMYDYKLANGVPAIEQAILFAVDHRFAVDRTQPWVAGVDPANEYYNNTTICQAINCADNDSMLIITRGSRIMSFTTLFRDY